MSRNSCFWDTPFQGRVVSASFIIFLCNGWPFPVVLLADACTVGERGLWVAIAAPKNGERDLITLYAPLSPLDTLRVEVLQQ